MLSLGPPRFGADQGRSERQRSTDCSNREKSVHRNRMGQLSRSRTSRPGSPTRNPAAALRTQGSGREERTSPKHAGGPCASDGVLFLLRAGHVWSGDRKLGSRIQNEDNGSSAAARRVGPRFRVATLRTRRSSAAKAAAAHWKGFFKFFGGDACGSALQSGSRSRSMICWPICAPDRQHQAALARNLC